MEAVIVEQQDETESAQTKPMEDPHAKWDPNWLVNCLPTAARVPRRRETIDSDGYFEDARTVASKASAILNS